MTQMYKKNPCIHKSRLSHVYMQPTPPFIPGWRHYTPIADRKEVQTALFLKGSQFLNTQIFEGEPGTSGGYHLTEVLPEPLKHEAQEVSYLTAGGRTN